MSQKGQWDPVLLEMGHATFLAVGRRMVNIEDITGIVEDEFDPGLTVIYQRQRRRTKEGNEKQVSFHVPFPVDRIIALGIPLEENDNG